MVNDPKLRAGLKFSHSSQTTSSDPQGVGELQREGTLGKFPQKDAPVEWQRKGRVGRGEGERCPPQGRVRGDPHPPLVTHTPFSPRLSWQPRAIFLTGNCIA